MLVVSVHGQRRRSSMLERFLQILAVAFLLLLFMPSSAEAG
jgi:hypothetical protein